MKHDAMASTPPPGVGATSEGRGRPHRRCDPTDWIALNLLPGLGPIGQRAALLRWGDPGEIAYRVSVAELRALAPRTVDIDELRQARRGLRRRAEREWRRCRRGGIDVMVEGDPTFPACLATLPDGPTLLYRRGPWDLPERDRSGPHPVEGGPPERRLSIVGTRRPTAIGRRVARDWAGQLGREGVAIISGGARGVDAAAHEGALDAAATTVAVLGCGVDRVYPAENRRLFDRIVDAGGALLSEFPLGTPPLAKHFPRRNRIVSALGAAVLVVEAGERSGTTITVDFALEQDRGVLVVPGAVTSPQSVGCHRLIQQGASLVHDVQDVLEALAWSSSAAPSARGATPSFDPDLFEGDERQVVSHLDPVEPTHVERIADEAGLSVAALQVALLKLQLHGAAVPLPGGYYLRGHPRLEDGG